MHSKQTTAPDTQADLINGAHPHKPAATAAMISSAASSSLSTVNVLVTDEHYKHSLGIVRHLGRQGARVSVVANSLTSLACRSRYCREVILSHEGTLDSLVNTSVSVLREKHFDLIMPVSYSMTLALAQRRDEILARSRLELSSSETIQRAANKLYMTELAGILRVPVPRTIEVSELPARAKELRFPVVIKPQQESAGRPPIRYAHNVAELSLVLAQVRALQTNGTPANYLVQEYIPGYGCGFFATYQDGVCKRVFMHRRIREYPAAGGVSSCAESFYDLKLESYGRRMLDSLNWHGVAMVEFRRDTRDGEYKLMEINPKFWGSLDLALAAGADFPGDLCKMALGGNLAFCDHYTRGMRFHWPWSGQGDLFHLWTRPQSVFAVAADYLNPNVKSNVWLRDLGPNLEELRNLLRRGFHRRKG